MCVCVCVCALHMYVFLSVFVATPLSGRPLHVLGVNCRHILLYNLGLQQLFLGKPLLAFESLLEAVQVYHSNPRLWLRLAEACIATHCVVSGTYLLSLYVCVFVCVCVCVFVFVFECVQTYVCMCVSCVFIPLYASYIHK